VRPVTVVLAVLGALLLGVVSGVALHAPTRQGSGTGVPPVTITVTDTEPVGLAALATVLPATVTVRAGGSTGTGVILSADGEIVTNAHVVDGAGPIRVLLYGAIDAVEARLVAVDDESDLALLRIDGQNLPVVAFAPDIVLGEEVIAVGYALGLEGEPTVTRGIVSATRRTIPVGDGVLANLVQTDAPISSGNSGGPLLNRRGEVVGINTVVYRDTPQSAASNIGFAIRADAVLAVVEQLRSGGPHPRGVLGVLVAGRADGGRGGRVVGVTPGGPAESAGVREGDLVLRVDETPISGRNDLIGAIRTRKPGEMVELEVVRGNQRLTVAVTLGESGDGGR